MGTEFAEGVEEVCAAVLVELLHVGDGECVLVEDDVLLCADDEERPPIAVEAVRNTVRRLADACQIYASTGIKDRGRRPSLRKNRGNGEQ